MKIFVVGFPYVRERYFATWRHYPEPDSLRFLLPQKWTAKGGEVVFRPPADPRVATTLTLFSHSHVPLVGGLLKGWMPAFPVHLWRMRKEISLVYACSEPTLLSTFWFAIWTKLLRKKLVFFTWENIPYEKKFSRLSFAIHYALLAINLFLADGLICGNPEGELVHRQYTGGSIAVIPMNGVDAEFFTPGDYPRPEGIPADKTIFTFIGAIGYRKGIHLAVRAFPEVLKKVPGAHLVIAGSGEYDSELTQELERAGIAGHFTRYSWLDDKGVRALLSHSDVFLYPSIPHGGWAEQFGYSMAEASLMELPVIATRSGSISHVVQDGVTGLLAEPGNEKELADAMVRLGSDAELRGRLGRAGRRHVAEQFVHAAVARKFQEFFRGF